MAFLICPMATLMVPQATALTRPPDMQSDSTPRLATSIRYFATSSSVSRPGQSERFTNPPAAEHTSPAVAMQAAVRFASGPLTLTMSAAKRAPTVHTPRLRRRETLARTCPFSAVTTSRSARPSPRIVMCQ
ncbi:MAG: hypothetical protein U0169_26260 [Polyangiaceae bacterium]